MIFVSYAREDRAYVRDLEREMASENIPFLRDISLAEGDPFWRNKITDQLKQCSVMVIIASKHAQTSPWVEQEIRAFHGRKLLVSLDDSSIISAELDRSQSRLVSRSHLIASIGQLLSPGTRSRNAFRPMAKTPFSEAEVAMKRKNRLFAEQAHLSQFLRTLDGRRTANIDVYGDIAINRFDGTQMRRIPEECTGVETSKRALYLGIEPVTNAQYREFIKATGVAPPPTWEREDFARPHAPVVGINWYDASAYAAWVGASLPTEEEWERAARGLDKKADYATLSGCIGPNLAYYTQTFGYGAPVPGKDYPANQNGFFGMCGNTWDWCSSQWGSNRVIRGGGYMDSALFCRIQARYRNAPLDRDCCVGFRIKVEMSCSS